MSLVPDYSSSSDEDIIGNGAIKQSDLKAKLPSANILLAKEKGEVFNNPYKEAEDAKIASLEKHVKMVDTGEHVKEKNGKKICWNYRKGRCRFGSSCTFAHDSDLSTTAESTSASLIAQKKDIPTIPIISKPQQGLQLGNLGGDSKSVDKTIKRNRPGLGDSIVPSKKVQKQYTLQKKKFP